MKSKSRLLACKHFVFCLRESVLFTNDEISRDIKYPALVYPHDCSKSGEVWFHLLRYCSFLNLHSHPVPRLSILTFQPSSVYLGNAGTGNCVLFKVGKDTIRTTWRSTKFFLKDASNLCKRDLWRIVK